MNEKRCWSCGEMIPRDLVHCRYCNARQSMAKPTAMRARTGAEAKKSVDLEAVSQEHLLVMMLEAQDRLLKSQDRLLKSQQELRAVVQQQTAFLGPVRTAAIVWLVLVVLGGTAAILLWLVGWSLLP